MPEKGQRITVLLTQTEHNFIAWCRKAEFAECRVVIKDGQPYIAKEVVKSHRFDIDRSED